MTKYILSKSFELNEIIINQYIISLMYEEEDIYETYIFVMFFWRFSV